MTFRAFTAWLLVILSGLYTPSARLWAQNQDAPPPLKLNIVIVEGDGAINNIKQRVAREPIVQVEDENRKPLAGASVAFLLPSNGASGTFSGGSKLLTVVTDNQGRAVMRGLTTNNVKGPMQIRVTASYRGQTASTTITQTNAIGAAAAGAGAGMATGKLIAIIAVVGGAAAAGAAVAATRGGGGGGGAGTTGPAATPTVINPGNPSVGPPR